MRARFALPRTAWLPTLALLLALAPLRARAEKPAPPPPPAPTPAALALAQAQSAFALALYPRLAAGGRNVLFSPYSIHTALAMARAGARGETAAQMDRVLRLPADGAAQAAESLVRSVTTAPSVKEWLADGTTSERAAYTLSVANALWGQQGYAFVPAFRQTVATSYGALFEEVDFRNGPAVRKRINDWVLSKTNDKVRDLVPDGLPTPDTRLALVNAIHFYALWTDPFSEQETQEKPFTDVRGVKSPVHLMRNTDHYRYLEDGKARVLAIPYRGGAAELLVVLPKDPAGLADLEKDLTPEALARWTGGGQYAEVALSFPRFRYEAPVDLGGHLAALGMLDAFDRARADFTGIADVKGDPLFLGAALHKAFIAVDERGTEAAAATALMVPTTAAPGTPPPPIPFVCDRPFLFFLHHLPTGALLFVGRLATPEPAAPAPGR